MSFLKKSLEKRIQELHESIEAQTTELAAYEQVLALESGKPAEDMTAAAELSYATKVESTKAPSKKALKKASKKIFAKTPQSSPAASAPGVPITAEFNGSRSDFVIAAINERGSAGITPLEISAAFAGRKIAVSKNLVYNVLSLLFKRKRVRKDGGRYYSVAGNAAPAPAAVAKRSSAKPAAAKSTAPKKRRISEEGMRRIIAATKKRWALKRAGKGK
jgi:hypothetical protein